MDFGMTNVIAVTVLCYLAAQALKATTLDNKWLPVICGALGGILGVVAWRVMAGYPAEDFLTAAAVGVVSGLAATGVNQIGKQLRGNNQA